jgi:hypothetical protein
VSRSLTKLAAQPVRRVLARFERYCRAARLRVYIAHDIVAVCRTEGRFRPKIREKTILPLPSMSRESAHELSEALLALAAWLQRGTQQGAVEWIVGFDQVRYLTLPWDERLYSKSFCHALAKALLSRQLEGNDVTTLSSAVLHLAPAAHGRSRLAALIPGHVVNTLVSFSKTQGWRTTKITPALAVVWDNFFNRFRKGQGTLALIEGQRLQHIAYDRGNIVGLKVRPFREMVGPSPHDVADFRFPSSDTRIHGGEALQVQGMVPGDDIRLAYALCGVR